MANAARNQADFNLRVERFMESARAWGRVGMILYGTGQALLVGAILKSGGV
jgi:hypothetical protein